MSLDYLSYFAMILRGMHTSNGEEKAVYMNKILSDHNKCVYIQKTLLFI